MSEQVSEGALTPDPELDRLSCTGTDSERGDSGDEGGEVMNEQLGVTYDTLGYETRGNARRHNTRCHGI